MDITKIHTGSFATRIGQTAAAEVAGLLAIDDHELAALPIEKWFDQSRPDYPDDEGNRRTDEEIERMIVLEKLGDYVFANQVDQGERLYRWATGERLVVPIGDWPLLTFAQRQPWETFTSTARQAFNELKAAQLAILDVRKAAAAPAPAGLKKEDSIFEEVEDMFELRPEAVEALKLTGIYERGQEAERQRLAYEAEDAVRAEAEAYNAQWDKFGGDPSKFDHDGNGKPGGSKPQRPKPLSAGETVTQPPRNRGGRGNKKPT